MAFTIDPQTGKINFGVVSDGTHDAVARDIAKEFGVSETFKDDFNSFSSTFNDNFDFRDTGNANPDGDVQDPFAFDNYTDQDSPNIGVNLGTNRLEFDGVARGSTNQASTADYNNFVFPFSNTAILIRFKLEITAFTDTDGAQQSVYIGASDLNSTNDSQASHSFMGIEFHASSGNPNGQLVTNVKNGDTLKTFGTVIDPAMGVAVRFIEIRRTDATSVTISSFSDSTYETRVSSVTEDATGIEDLRFFGVWNLNDGFTSTNNIDGYIDDVKIWYAERDFDNSLLRESRMQWVPTGLGWDANTDPATEKLEATFQHDGNANIVTHDLLQDVTAVSENQWTLRFRVKVNSLTKGTSTVVSFALTDTEAGGALGVTQDSISGVIDLQNSLSEGYGIGNTAHDNSTLPIQAKPAGKQTVAIALNTPYFVELSRVSNIKATMQIFTDPQYTIPLSGISSDVIPSTVQALRYIKFFEREAGFAGDISYEVDDMEFFNGQSQHSWTSTDNTKIDVKNSSIDFTVVRDGTNDAIAFDLGSVSNTSWVLRYKLQINQLNDGTNVTGFIGISDTDQDTDYEGTKDFIGTFFTQGTSAKDIGSVDIDAGNMQSGQNTAFTTQISVSTFYVEIVRDSATGMTMRLFSDNGYTNLIEENSEVISSSITGLRHLLVQGITSPSTTATAKVQIDDMQFWNNTTVPVISSLDWRMRFDLKLTNLDDGANTIDKRLYVGLFDEDGTSGANNAQDGYLLLTNHDNTFTTFNVRTPNNEAPRVAPNDIVLSTSPTVNEFFVELRRTSATDGSVTLYTDNTFATPLESDPVTTLSGTDNLKYLKLMNDEISDDTGEASQGAIDGTFDNFNYVDFEQAVLAPQQTVAIVDAILEGAVALEEEFIVNALLQATFEKEFIVNALLQAQGANGACPSGAEAVSSVLDNIDDWDTQVNTGSTNFKIGQRWTPTVGEVALLENGITKVNLWHGHTGGSGSFDTFVWSNAGVGTSSETIVRDGGTFNFIGSSSGIAKRNRTLFDATGTFVEKWLPTAGVEYVIGIVEDFPGTAQTRKTSTDTNNGVFTTRSSAGNWTDTVGQDWTLQFTIEQSGLGQGEQNFCLSADGILQSLGDNGSCVATYMNDFTSGTGFVSTDIISPGFVIHSVAGGNISWEGLADGSNDTGAIDFSDPTRLGTSLSGDFRVRFDVDFTTVGLLTFFNHIFFHVSDSDQTVNAGTGSEDSIGLHVQIGASGQVVTPFYKDGSATLVQVANLQTGLTSGSKFFYEIIRNGTSVTFNAYSDAYVTLVATQTDTVPLSVTGLTHFKVGNWAFGNSANSLFGDTDNLDILVSQSSGNTACPQVDAFIQAQGENSGCNDVFDVVTSRGEQDQTFGPGISGSTGFGEGFGIRFTPKKDFFLKEVDWNSTRGGGTGGRYTPKLYLGSSVPTSGNISAGGLVLVANGALDFGNSGRFSQFIVFWTTGSQRRTSSFDGFGTTQGVFLTAGTEYFLVFQEVDINTGWTLSTTTVPPGNSSTDGSNPKTNDFITVQSSNHWNATGTFTLENIELTGEEFAFDMQVEAQQSAGCAQVDVLLQTQDQEKDFFVNAILDQQIQTIDKEFQVHARLAVRKEFIVDAIVRYAQGTSLLGGIPDLIIRVLRENGTLTGIQIVEEINIITSDPAEGFSFVGKTSRIKNWLNRLRLDNLILDDGSNPDWYRTNWSLNPAVFP